MRATNANYVLPLPTGKIMPNALDLDRLIDDGEKLHKEGKKLEGGRIEGKAEMLMQTTPYAIENTRKTAEKIRSEQLRIERHVVLQQFASSGFFHLKPFCTWDCCREYIDDHAPPQVL